MTAPLTLAEFECLLADALALYPAGYISDMDEMMETCRPLILRLLAGERDRCARTLATAARQAFEQAMILQDQFHPSRHMEERRDTLEFAEDLVRRMGGPE